MAAGSRPSASAAGSEGSWFLPRDTVLSVTGNYGRPGQAVPNLRESLSSRTSEDLNCGISEIVDTQNLRVPGILGLQDNLPSSRAF